jgi:hypothetical protein
MILSPISNLRDPFSLSPARRRPAQNPPKEVFAAPLHYGILIPRRSIQDRKLMQFGGKERPVKEAVMLDVAFVALGIAVLALMGVYALALRQF